MSAPDDADDLRVLVELAASGQLSADERAEVERLIADKPQLLAEYERLRQPAAPPRTAGSSTSGCLVGIIAFVVAAVAVTIGAIIVRSGGGDDQDTPTDPVAAIIESPDQQILELDGPDELAGFGNLALIAADGRAVLLGDEIPTAGTLVLIDGDDEVVVAEFDAGQVSIVLDDIDTDADYAVRPAP